MTNRKNLASELSSILDDARRDYARCQENDRIAQAKSGARSINGDFVFDENRTAARGVVSSARSKALDAIDRQIKRAEDALTNAPTADEANYIAAIRGRTDYTRDEMNAALSRYPSHAAQKAIITAAKASELVPDETTTTGERDLSDLRELRSDVSRTYTDATFGNMSGGMASLTAAGYAAFAEGNSSSDAVAAFSNL